MTKAALVSILMAAAAAVALPGLSPNPSGIGGPCATVQDCIEGTACVADTDGEALCMALCHADDRVCEDGSACLPRASGEGHVCYIGGHTPIGDECSSNAECDYGVCVRYRGEARCYAPCHLDDPLSCGDELLCSPIEDADDIAGFCHS